MKQFLAKNYLEIILLLAGNATLAYGAADLLDFTKTLAVITSAEVIGLLIYLFLNNKTEEKDTTLDDIVALHEAKDAEQVEVIQEYEKIFDSQLVELPCICGGNTFQGLFSPKTENVVECENCKCKYRVNISYDSVLISEPMNVNETFDKLVGTPPVN